MPFRVTYSFIAALLVSFPAIAQADQIETTSHVTAATIFTDRAIVTREGKTHIPAGAHSIVLTDMPAGFDEASLQVKGSANGEVKIGTVDVKHVFLAEEGNTAERDKTSAVQAKIDEKAQLQGEITALKARETFINRLVDNGGDSHDSKDGSSKLDFTPDKWAQAWTSIQNGMGETEKALADKDVAMRKLDVDIAKLQAELAQVETNRAKERRSVTINVDAAQDSELTLDITYQTRGASWRPVYDARLNTSDNKLSIDQYGLASQQTGEDWNDIDLTFSTAQAASGSEMPRLSPWWVALFQPVRQRLAQAAMQNAGNAGSNGMYFNEQAKEAELANAVSAPIFVPATDMPAVDKKLEAVSQASTAQTTEYSAEFHVPGHVSLQTTRDTSKIFVAATKMTAELMVETTPRLAPQAYLFAKVTNDGAYPLIPGMVSKYRDGTFVGNAPFALLRSKENAQLSFGVDDRVKVERELVSEEHSNPTLVVVGDIKIDTTYQNKVRNLHKEPIKIVVFDQYPVARDPDVHVELIDDATTKGYEVDADKRPGVISWTSSYAPNEEQTLTIGYRVSYPKDRQLTGLQ